LEEQARPGHSAVPLESRTHTCVPSLVSGEVIGSVLVQHAGALHVEVAEPSSAAIEEA